MPDSTAPADPWTRITRGARADEGALLAALLAEGAPDATPAPASPPAPRRWCATSAPADGPG